jgi:radical SAM superfamily enzyme YgiQ (UPF0313 family)
LRDDADVVLIHPPSVYDFRERTIFYGPISDVIPSSPVFEMYPVGFLTMAAYLRRHGYRVRIVNLALLMMRSRRFRPERLLATLKPKLFGIDLHWLPHAHGGPEVAALLKRLHPEIPIVFGGISATYFHEELIRDPSIDFVLRGSVTEPALLALLRELGGERRFERVPNLTWKTAAVIPSGVVAVDGAEASMARPSPGIRPPSPGGRGVSAQGRAARHPLFESLLPPGEGARRADEGRASSGMRADSALPLEMTTQINTVSLCPTSLDDYDIDLGMMAGEVVRRLDFWTSIPFHFWWRHPITAVFTVRGCARGCVTCGASSRSFDRYMPGHHPLFRSPEAIGRMVRDLAGITRAPIFLVGDIGDGGPAYARAVVDAIGATRVTNRIIFEFFQPPDDALLSRIESSIRHWGAELSPESHDERVRALLGKARYTNAALENAIQSILIRRCEQLDLFFMIGLPGQTYRNVLETVDTIEQLFMRFGRRLSAFITPMGPFIDPGSDGFEEAEGRGYRIRARTLAEHRALLEKPDWESILNYETEWMTRSEIVDATYDSAERLNELKARYGRITREVAEGVAQRLAAARTIRGKLAAGDPDGLLAGEIRKFSEGTINDKGELFPPGAFLRNFRIGGIARLLWRDMMKNSKKALIGAAAFAAYSITAAVTRKWHTRWGVTDEEIAEPLPGDELMPFASANHAVTVDAPPDVVWRWLVQIGQDRGGFYSYTWLENAVLADIHNAKVVHPEWQQLHEGDFIRLGSKRVYGDRTLLRVAAVEPSRYLVLEGWGAFVLKPVEGGKTRVIIRSHGRKQSGPMRAINFIFFEPAHFIMERKMLLGLKARAEKSAAIPLPIAS